MKICVQSGGIVEHIGAEKCYDLIEKAGFGGIDWNAVEHACPYSTIADPSAWEKCIYLRPLEEVLAYFEPEIRLIRSHGLTISQAHAPFPAYIPGVPGVLEYMVGIYKRVIEVCDYAGCRNVIIHGISYDGIDAHGTPEGVMAMNDYLYESLIPTLQRCNVTVCLENLFTSRDGKLAAGICCDPQEAAAYIDALNEKAGKEAFGLCLDIGHLHLVNGDVERYTAVMGSRIKCLHIHDNDGISDNHLAPMAGRIRWKQFCSALHAVGYAGDLSFETFAQSRAALAVNEAMLLPSLQYVCAIGENFRSQIQQE